MDPFTFSSHLDSPAWQAQEQLRRDSLRRSAGELDVLSRTRSDSRWRSIGKNCGGGGGDVGVMLGDMDGFSCGLCQPKCCCFSSWAGSPRVGFQLKPKPACRLFEFRIQLVCDSRMRDPADIHPKLCAGDAIHAGDAGFWDAGDAGNAKDVCDQVNQCWFPVEPVRASAFRGILKRKTKKNKKNWFPFSGALRFYNLNGCSPFALAAGK